MIRTTFIDIMPIFKPGDPRPDGYMEGHEWARVQMRAGLRQSKCRGCGLWLFPQERDEHKCKPNVLRKVKEGE